MSDEIFDRGTRIVSKFASLLERKETLLGFIKNEKLLLEKAEKKHARDLEEIGEINKGVEAMKQAVVPLTRRGLQGLKDLVSFGLGTIFFDELYSLDIEIQERGNDKTAELWLLEGTGDDVLRVPVRDSIGEGVKTVIALIFRVFFILHYKQRRVVMMDEPFSDVATKYIPGLFKFLRHTVEDLGFRWLMVTHDARFLPYGDAIYRVSKGHVKLVSSADQDATKGDDGAHA